MRATYSVLSLISSIIVNVLHTFQKLPIKKIYILYIFIRGALGKFVAWQCVDNMLSKNTYFWKLEFKRLFGGSIFVEKGLDMHVQRMLEMTRCLLTGGKF